MGPSARVLNGSCRASRSRAESHEARSEVALTGNPAEPLPEFHVAPGVPTLLLFPSDINKKTLTVDESRIRVVDKALAQKVREFSA